LDPKAGEIRPILFLIPAVHNRFSILKLTTFARFPQHALGILPHGYLTEVSIHFPSAGAFAVAFVLTKITGPIRLMIDIAITPTLAGYLRHTWLAGNSLATARQTKCRQNTEKHRPQKS
jgi:hypothetical protein